LLGAQLINEKKFDITINWAGGLHHAKSREASGFCYVNDCVLAILELLKVHQRVLYIDIDMHHGDGVEEAFYTTNRVMTCSFHKFGDNYFPGTGHDTDIGIERGKYHSVNFPLQEGMDDDSFIKIFKPVIDSIIKKYQPGAIILQCGADSISGDRLGCFNLSIKGHGECVKIVKTYNIPMILLGGGGYTLRNVPRCWAYETSIALGIEIPNEIPKHDFYDYFCPEYKLHMSISNMENKNSKKYLRDMSIKLLENLKHVSTGTEITPSNYGLKKVTLGFLSFKLHRSQKKWTSKKFSRSNRTKWRTKNQMKGWI